MSRSAPYRLLVLTLALLPPPLLAVESAWTGYSGVASDPDTGVFRYREQHWLHHVDGKLVERLVRYRCPDGAAFAEKRVDYRDSTFAPTFALEDRRARYREGLRPAANGLEVFVQRPGEPAAAVAPVARTPTLVADAGFDEFLLDRWPVLARGEAVRFDFLVPSEREPIGFKVKPVADADPGVLVARLSLGAWWGFLAPSLDARYDRRTKRLMRYEGLSNLRDGEGNNLLVRIDFPDAPAPVAPPKAETLVARCEASIRSG